jgi:hypothetical protein
MLVQGLVCSFVGVFLNRSNDLFGEIRTDRDDGERRALLFRPHISGVLPYLQMRVKRVAALCHHMFGVAALPAFLFTAAGQAAAGGRRGETVGGERGVVGAINAAACMWRRQRTEKKKRATIARMAAGRAFCRRWAHQRRTFGSA